MKTFKNKKTRFRTSGKLNGRELSVSITGLTNTGDGIGRVDQQVVFVRHTMPGDEVRIKVTKDKGTFLLADLLEVTSPSPDRIEPPCKYFGHCGGCDWLHIPYSLQIETKFEQLKETLHRIGGLTDINIQDVVVSPKILNYRNRVQGHIHDGEFHFKKRGSNKLIAIAKCEIADENVNARLAKRFEGVANSKVELSVSNGLVNLEALNAKQTTELGFRQVNTGMGEILTDLVLSSVSESNFESVNDLYCGRGDWTNEIARRTPDLPVLGVDSMPENIALARSRASSAGLQNVKYIQAAVEDALDKIKVKNSFCIVDPPRAGLDAAVCNALCKRPATELIYVSCHAATLSRDLKILTSGGYQIVTLQPLDMFPQTSHLETMVKLRPK